MNENNSQSAQQVEIITFRKIWDIVKKYLPFVAAGVIVFAIIAAIFGTIWETSTKQSYAVSTVSLEYSGAENGKNPDGSAFDSQSIVSFSNITDALKNSRLNEKYSVADVADAVSVKAVVPSSIQKVLNSVSENSELTLEQFNAIKFVPTQFNVVVDCAKISENDALLIADNIAKAFISSFKTAYFGTTAFDIALPSDISDYDADYLEMADSLSVQLSAARSAITKYAAKAPDFISSENFSFSVLASSFAVLQDNCDKLSSYIASNGVLKDIDATKDFLQYRLDNLTAQIASKKETLSTLQALIDAYKYPTVNTGINTAVTIATSEIYNDMFKQASALSGEIEQLSAQNTNYTNLLNIIASTASVEPEKTEYVENSLTSLVASASSALARANNAMLQYNSAEGARAISVSNAAAMISISSTPWLLLFALFVIAGIIAGIIARGIFAARRAKKAANTSDFAAENAKE